MAQSRCPSSEGREQVENNAAQPHHIRTSSPAAMTTKSKSKQEEALAFLDDLDNIAPPPPEASTGAGAPPAAAAPKPGEGEAEFLAFIDEITQKSAEPVPQVKTRSPAATLLSGANASED